MPPILPLQVRLVLADPCRPAKPVCNKVKVRAPTVPGTERRGGEVVTTDRSHYSPTAGWAASFAIRQMERLEADDYPTKIRFFRPMCSAAATGSIVETNFSGRRKPSL